MQEDLKSKAILQMEEWEKTLYRLYDQENMPRDYLPYSENFDRIVVEFNKLNGSQFSHHEMWRKLLAVLKRGEGRIRQYLGLS